MSQFANSERSYYSNCSNISEASLLNEEFVDVELEYFDIKDDDTSSSSSSSGDELDELTPAEIEGEVLLLRVPEPIDDSFIEDNVGREEIAATNKFLGVKCCPLNCTSSFTTSQIIEMRNECAELDVNDEFGNRLDLIILGLLRALTRTEDEISHSNRPSISKKRARETTSYLLRGKPVCRSVFLYAHKIGKHRWNRIQKQFKADGLCCAPHGNRKHFPRHSLEFQKRAHIINFIANYAEETALFLPGRQGNYREIVKLLPSNETKRNIYTKYTQACANSEFTPVSYTSFIRCWNTCLPFIIIQRPRTDLCATCQASYVSHSKLKGQSEEVKEAFFRKGSEHLARVDIERKYYFNQILQTREFLEKNPLSLNYAPRHCSYSGPVHISFDFAQQVHVPALPQQPGPIYFLVPYKVGIFGVMSDTLNIQGNYVIPEAVSVAKGSNIVVSYVHDFLEKYHLGERELWCHADNCCAQNKNNTVLRYLMFRILSKMNRRVVYSFLPVGHTKFSVDWALGLVKKLIRYEEVHDVDDVCRVIENSSRVNTAIPTGTEKGDLLVPVYDWAAFFDRRKWKKIPNITQYYHFTIDAAIPGYVLCQKTLDDPGQLVQMVEIKPKKRILFKSWPKKVPVPGLSEARLSYLRSKIVPFAKETSKLRTL